MNPILQKAKETSKQRKLEIQEKQEKDNQTERTRINNEFDKFIKESAEELLPQILDLIEKSSDDGLTTASIEYQSIGLWDDSKYYHIYEVFNGIIKILKKSNELKGFEITSEENDYDYGEGCVIRYYSFVVSWNDN